MLFRCNANQFLNGDTSCGFPHGYENELFYNDVSLTLRHSSLLGNNGGDLYNLGDLYLYNSIIGVMYS